MKRVLVGASVLVIIGSVAIVAWARKRHAQLEDEAVVNVASSLALPSLVKRLAKTCQVPNPDATAAVELALVFETTPHGIEVLEAQTLDGGSQAGVECLTRALPHQRYEDPELELAPGHQYQLDVVLPLPASGISY